MKSFVSKRVIQAMTLSVFTLFLVFGACKKTETCPTCDRDSFVGTYKVTKGSTKLGVDIGEIIAIKAGVANDALVVDGANATVSGSSFTIPKQDVVLAFISGNGTLSGKTLTLNVTFSDATTSVSDTVIYDKQ